MRILVDMQAAQTGSRFRGIGRYARELVKALVRQGGGHRVILALNGHFADTIEDIRAEFLDLIPQRDIRVWYAPGPVGYVHDDHKGLRKANEVLREYFFLAQKPDVILLPSLFEGLNDSAVISVDRARPHVPVVSVCHDLIPLVDPSPPFEHDRITRLWYRKRLDALRRSDLILTNSTYSNSEVTGILGVQPERVVTIGAGHDAQFHRKDLSDSQRAQLAERLGIAKPFVMFAGSLEPSKNVPNFLKAMGALPPRLQEKYQIVVVGKREPDDIAALSKLAPNQIVRGALRVLGHVSDEVLVDLYNACEAFVFPSKREGFGLPALEAMACGAPVIASNRTSLPEVIGLDEALFDPDSIGDMTSKINKVLTDGAYRERLVVHGLDRATSLNWDACAAKTLQALRRFERPANAPITRRSKIFAIDGIASPKKQIILSKLDHAGDFLLALPAMAKIRARYPDSRIDALVGSWNRVAAEHCGLFDNVYTLDYFRAKSSLQARVDVEEIDNLQTQLPYYDYAIDLRRHSDTRFILLALRASQYFGYRTGNPRYDENLTRPLDIHPEPAGERDFFDEMHISEQMLRIVDTLPSAVSDYVGLPAFGAAKPVPGTVGIFPRVGSDARQWDSERFVELVDRLCADDTIGAVNLFGVNRQELDEIGFHPHPKIAYQCGLQFPELVKVLGANQVCVGNNSFGVHLGSLVGCSTVAIYSGHEMPEQWGPAFGNVDVVTANVECSPCHLPTKESCPFAMRCLTSIEVDTVFDAVKAKLAPAEGPESAPSLAGWTVADCLEQAVRALNRLKFRGETGDLTTENKNALQAALLVNFPVRPGPRPQRLYVDISGFVPGNGETEPRSALDQFAIEAMIDWFAGALPDHRVETIASGLHDHEFYVTSINEVDGFFNGNRVTRVVYPMPGDLYVGLDRYVNRNAAQWDLLQSWRELGVRISFAVDDNDLAVMKGAADASDIPQDRLLQARRNLVYLSNFDVLLLRSIASAEAMRAFIAEHGPRRSRAIELVINSTLDDLRAEMVATSVAGREMVLTRGLREQLAKLASALANDVIEARFEVAHAPAQMGDR